MGRENWSHLADLRIIFCLFLSAAQFLYNRDSEQHLGSYISKSESIIEVPEEEEEEEEEREDSLQHSGSFTRPHLSDVDEG